MKNTLKIFEGTKVCWVGVNSEEIIHMNEILINNGGSVTTLDDSNCTHVVSSLDDLIYASTRLLTLSLYLGH